VDGQVISSRYQILRRLDAGGQGVVHLAFDRQLNRKVAIKFPNKEESGSDTGLLLSEARKASQLTHPNIARIYDFGHTDSGQPYLVMELIEGESLRSVLSKGPLSEERTRAVMGELLSALEAAHAAGLIHRDIKPANIMLDEQQHVKMLDFGLARHVSVLSESGETLSITVHQGIVGTPRYMSPEQARGGHLDSRSDLFSCGSVLYECLTGKPAFSGRSTMEVLDRIASVQPEAPCRVRPELAAYWDAVVAKALAKTRDERFQTAAEMSAALLSPASMPESASVPRRMSRRWAIAAAALGAAALGAYAVWPGVYRPAADAERFYNEGVTALRDGTYQRASTALTRAVQLDGKFTLAHARLAEAWSEMEYLERAQAELLQALDASRRVTPDEELYLEGLRLTLSRDFAQAVTKFQALADRASAAEKSHALVDLGRAQEKVPAFAKALASYQAASKLDPQDPSARLRMAVILSRDPKTAQAGEAEFRRAEELYMALSNPEGVAEVAFQRGRIMVTNKRPAEARQLLQKSLDLAVSASNVYQQVSSRLVLGNVFYLEGKTAQAEQEVAAALDLARQGGFENLVARGIVDAGNVKLNNGEYARAESDYREAMNYSVEHHLKRQEARALLSLASAHLQLSRPDEALAESSKARQYYAANGFSLEVFLALQITSRAQRQKADFPAALATARQMVSSAAGDSQKATAVETVAGVLGSMENYPEAIAARLQMAADAREAKDTLGVAYAMTSAARHAARLGRFDDATRYAAEAEAAAGDSKPVATLLASLRAELEFYKGRYAAAFPLARKAMELAGARLNGTAVEVRLLAAECRRRNGSPAESRALLLEAEQIAKTMDDPVLRHIVVMAKGEPESLAETCSFFAAVHLPESAWRCAAVQHEALLRIGKKQQAAAAAESAKRLLTSMLAGWSEENRKFYLARPDLLGYYRGISY